MTEATAPVPPAFEAILDAELLSSRAKSEVALFKMVSENDDLRQSLLAMPANFEYSVDDLEHYEADGHIGLSLTAGAKAPAAKAPAGLMKTAMAKVLTEHMRCAREIALALTTRSAARVELARLIFAPIDSVVRHLEAHPELRESIAHMSLVEVEPILPSRSRWHARS